MKVKSHVSLGQPEVLIIMVKNRTPVQRLLINMTHHCCGVVWSLCSMSSQVDDVNLLREAGCASACTARQCGEAIQRGLHWVTNPHRQQLTWAAKQRPCDSKNSTVWMNVYGIALWAERTLQPVRWAISGVEVLEVWHAPGHVMVNLTPSGQLSGYHDGDQYHKD